MAGLSEQARNRLASLLRFIVLIPMVGLGIPIGSYTHRAWTDYWLSKDAKQTTALIIQAHPKRVFDYKYAVDGKEYSGTSWRDWEDEKIHALRVGEQTTVLFSSSHPGLSSMQSSRTTWAGLPFLVLMLLMEFFCLAVLIDPNGRWSVSRWLLNMQNQRLR